MADVEYKNSDDVSWTNSDDVSWLSGATDYLFSIGSGTFILTGTDAFILRDAVLDAGSGSYALTGSDINMLVGKVFSVGSGSYAITGTDAEILRNIKLDVSAGSYVITGSAIDFVKNYPFSVGSGSYMLSGQNIFLLHDKRMDVGNGSYALTGTDAEILRTAVISAGAGSYTLTGSDLTFVYMPIVYDGDLGWKADRNLGVWSFSEQEDKFGYLNNKNWSKIPEAVTFCEPLNLQIDKEDKHLPCGHWHKKIGGNYSLTSSVSVNTGEWCAAKERPGTSYIYFYDVTYKAAIKITAANPATLDEMLPLTPTGSLDHGSGIFGVQRGGYCMSKNGNTLWYLFRDSDNGNCQLIEIDISESTMSITRKTTFEALVPGESIQDGCTDDTYTYWATSLLSGRIIKIRNSDHAIIDDHLFNYPMLIPGSFDQSIVSLDYDPISECLYWVYTRNESNAYQYLIQSDIDLTELFRKAIHGSGLSTPGWSTMLRMIEGEVNHHYGYHPFYGYFVIRDTAFSGISYAKQYQLKNILGTVGNFRFNLSRNDTASVATLYCLAKTSIGYTALATLKTLNVTSYIGSNNVSVLSTAADIVVLVRWDGTYNYVTCISADSDLTVMGIVPLNSILTTTTVTTGNADMIEAEPVVWRI